MTISRAWRRSPPTIRSREDLELALREIASVEDSELRIPLETEAVLWCVEKRLEGRLDSEDHFDRMTAAQ